jgi:AcrR family transcriptional regulator
VSAAHDTVQRAFEALLIKARTEGLRAPTVASIAARAGISRASMYRFHPDVVARIQALSAPSQTAQHDAIRAKVRLLTGQLKAEKDLTKALARACAELAAEKVAFTEQLEEERLRFTLRLENLQKKLRGIKPVRLLHPT